MGRSRRIVSSALVLAIAAIAGILIGEVVWRVLVDGPPPPMTAAAAPPPPATPTSLAIETRPAPARLRSHVIALEVDRTMRIDGGARLGNAAALVASLRRLGSIDIVHVAPGAGVPWAEVVELVDHLRALEVRVALHDTPPE